jgi:isopentenyl diphosphate isomerase/L-lactate dehydrogenase-like FMN-dependent dehydrogenase
MTTKTDSAHTPGPWTQGKSANGRKAVFAECRGTIPIAYVGGNGQPHETEDANAALIAAAPDLYKALQLILEVSDKNDYATYSLVVRELAADALAKAGGK